jgi:hypothetical protein
MDYLVSLSDSSKRLLVVLTLDEAIVSKPAADVVFDLIGAQDIDQLVESNRLAAGMTDDLLALQEIIFDRDADGLMIRQSVYFTANGKELDPDASLKEAFSHTHSERGDYARLDLVVHDSQQPQESEEDSISDLARIFFLHQIAVGKPLDVTKDYPELQEIIPPAEKEGLIEIDVKKAAYKLTASGERVHQSYIMEAQDLIKRFDIYADVDVDSEGVARFDTGLGKDMRVPVYEIEGVDPFRARLLLGLNDGDWDALDNWQELATDRRFYNRIFETIERAPSIEEIGRDQLVQIIDQAKAIIRSDPYTKRE